MSQKCHVEVEMSSRNVMLNLHLQNSVQPSYSSNVFGDSVYIQWIQDHPTSPNLPNYACAQSCVHVSMYFLKAQNLKVLASYKSLFSVSVLKCQNYKNPFSILRVIYFMGSIEIYIIFSQ